MSIVNRVERDTQRRWPSIENLDQNSESWTAATTATVTGAQREAVRATSGYLAAFLSSELGSRTRPPSTDSASYTGKTRDGRPLAEGLQSPLIGVRAALAEGKTPQEALQFGLDRALRMVELATKEAARKSLQDAMKADDRIIGWRRAVKGTCDACLGLASEATSPPGTPLEIHPGCQCVSEAAVRSQPSPKEKQDAGLGYLTKSGDINGPLWQGQELTGVSAQRARTLDAMISESPVVEPGSVFYRGWPEGAPVVTDGSPLVSRGFMSTTQQLERAGAYAWGAPPTVVRITVQSRGIRAFDVLKNVDPGQNFIESEWVFARGVRMKVTGVSEGNIGSEIVGEKVGRIIDVVI